METCDFSKNIKFRTFYDTKLIHGPITYNGIIGDNDHVFIHGFHNVLSTCINPLFYPEFYTEWVSQVLDGIYYQMFDAYKYFNILE